MMSLLARAETVKIQAPFPHFVGMVPDLLENLNTLQQIQSEKQFWKLHEASFYSQWENSTAVESIPGLQQFCTPETLNFLMMLVERSFDCKLSNIFRVNLLRLEPGQRISVHNDSPQLGYETHRVLIYLSSSIGNFTGGELVLFSDQHGSTAQCAYKPQCGMIFGFEASNTSYHGVMPVLDGCRMAIQYYFWHQGNEPHITQRLNDISKKSIELFPFDNDSKKIQAALRMDNRLAVRHGRGTLVDHLIETSAILNYFGAPKETCLAGLVHSVEGTGNIVVHGSLHDILGGVVSAPEVISLVKNYQAISHGAELKRLLTDAPNIGIEVLRIWWANVISSKRNIAFSKNRHQEEIEVTRLGPTGLSDLDSFIMQIYGGDHEANI